MNENNWIYNKEERASTALPDGCLYEIGILWDRYYDLKDDIIREEMDKDIDLGYEAVYEENYFDHWRIEELLERTLKAEDEIYTRWGTGD